MRSAFALRIFRGKIIFISRLSHSAECDKHILSFLRGVFSFTFLQFRGILTGKPAGYPTSVGERGHTLRSGASGTQKMEGTGFCSAIIGDAEPYIE